MEYKVLFVFLLFLFPSDAAFEGESCVKDDVAGTCKNINKCQAAKDDIKNKKYPQICSFTGTDPIVCCVESFTSTQGPVATTHSNKVTTTTEYVPPYYDYVNTYDRVGESACPPLANGLTASKNGRKAWDKCIEYQEQLVYPCEKSTALSGGMSRANHCYHNTDELIIGGVNAAQNEFPHMAMLGFGDSINAVQWLCGGSLISDKFVLTAGHCTFERTLGDVTYVAVGRYRRSDPLDTNKINKILRIIKHPEYKAPNKYNDIALLETENRIKLSQYVVPACLHIGNPIKDDRVIATGWGATQYRGENADILQKVKLAKFTREECAAKFPPSRLMKKGVVNTTQVCYGDRTMSKDSCQGDSGGPIQIYNNDTFCMYTVIGVTSFGKACGFVGDPGIYTKVAPYVPWIESIVWP